MVIVMVIGMVIVIVIVVFVVMVTGMAMVNFMFMVLVMALQWERPGLFCIPHTICTQTIEIFIGNKTVHCCIVYFSMTKFVLYYIRLDLEPVVIL